MTVPAFVQNFPAGAATWQYSGNGGATYGAAPAGTINQVAGPTGTQRYRTTFTIPVNTTGTWKATLGGDTYGTAGVPGQFYYDGVYQRDIVPLLGGPPWSGPTTFTLPAVPGTHTVEVWIGASPNNNPATDLTASFTFADTFQNATGTLVPCDCCPSGPPQCGLVPVQFNTVAETASQSGWNQVNLPLTIDGTTNSAALSGYTTTVGNTPSTTLRVTYGLGAARNRVRGLRLWNQGGSILTDQDGLFQFTSEFYSGVTLLGSVAMTAGNGAAPFTLLAPGGAEFNGVDSVVLRTMNKQIGGDQAPFWRELQLLETRTVFQCRRSDGTVEWYAADGTRVPAADVTAC